MSDSRAKRSIVHIPWAMWAAGLAFLMLLPSESFPESKLLSYDKLGHFGVFLIFTLLLSFAFTRHMPPSGSKIKRLTIALTISIVYGIALELLQQAVPGRMADIYDFIANTIGAVTGTIVFVRFTKISLRFLN